ncbi:MAG: secretion system protein [Halanaeroarchaeum sp.]
MADSLPATVPAPAPPDAPAAWYAPRVRDQYTVDRGIVATVSERDDGFDYRVREPTLSAASAATVDRVTDYLAEVPTDRPRTREGTVDRMAGGLNDAYRRVVDHLGGHSPAQRRRIEYHLAADLEGIGALTPHALDDRIRMADASGDRLLVHTADFAPADTGLSTDQRYLDRFASERVASYAVDVFGHDVPVTVSRERMLGRGGFTTQYHVRSPVRLPGDDELVERTRSKLVETPIGRRIDDPVGYVNARARRHLRRQLVADSPRALLSSGVRTIKSGLARVGLAVSPPRPASTGDRLDDLVSLVVRDLVGEGPLSVPLRDPHLERIEANRVGERIKVVPVPGAFDHDGRMPTTLRIDHERRFVSLATRLAAAGGVELGPKRPNATVTLEPRDGATARCAVALPGGDTEDPYVSIDKRGIDPVSPIGAVQAGVLDPDLVALLWLAIDRRRSVAFVGPERARPASLVEAHAPFIPYGDRPVTVAGATRTIRLPHETGVDLSPYPGGADAASALARSSDLAADVTVITDLDGEAAHRHLDDAVAAGRGVLASARATDFSTFADRIVARGMSRRLLGGLDLAIEVAYRDGRRVVHSVVLPTVDAENPPRIDATDLDVDRVVAVLAVRLGTDTADLRAAHDRRLRYVRFLVESGRTDVDDLFAFLADLRTDEAATLDRIRRVLAE